jgi:hypothetical protein
MRMYTLTEAVAFLLFAILLSLFCDAWWVARERNKKQQRRSHRTGRG